MADSLQLMMKNEVVMEINFDTAVYNVVSECLMPYQLRGRIQRVPDFTEIRSRYDDTQRQIIINRNSNAVTGFLANRVLPITRENAKKIYALFNFEQVQGELHKAKIAVVCRALSLQDNYWIRVAGDDAAWEDVNLRAVSLSEAVAQVSLHGTSLTLTNRKQEMMHTPELTGQGSYAKAWVREDDGLYLYKRGDNGITESKIEVMVSGILDNCNVKHLKYEAAESNSEYVCKCKCMTDDALSILPGMDFDSYCNVHGLDSREEALRIDSDSIYRMWIVDYLISNRDRHGMNWGFFYNCDTMKILGCHPLYDHNNSFDISYMQDRDAKYLYDDRMTTREAAKIAMQKVDFCFYKTFNRSDFLTERQYKSFTERAEDIGVPVRNKPEMKPIQI